MPSVKSPFLLVILVFVFNLKFISAQSSYTSIRQVNCSEKSSEFYLFYEGEATPFNYEKIGEVSSNEYSSFYTDQELINNLKYSAWENCANGLILIKSGFTGEEARKYYSAVAVRIQVNSDFRKKYGTGSDMQFVQQTEQSQIQRKNQSSAGLGFSMVCILLAVFLLTQLEL